MENPNVSSQAMNVNTVSAKQWSGTLDKIAQGKTTTGRTVVFLNKQGDVKVFNDEGLAEKAGYKKIKYEDIVKISKRVIDKDKNSEHKYEVGKKLTELTVRKDIEIANKYKSSSLNPISQVKGTIKKGEIKDAQKLVRVTGAHQSGSPAQLQALDEKLSKVKFAERSLGGIMGVIFLKSEDRDGENVVMKFLTNSSPVRLAEHFYEKAGFETAKSIFIPSDSGERAAKLVEIGKKTRIGLVADDYNPALPKRPLTDAENRTIATRQLNINLSIKAHEDIQISRDVHATAFNDKTMVEDAFLEIFNNPSFVKDLGRLALFDGFFGNSDRMQPWVIGKELNGGNLMVRETETGPKLVLIDNDVKLSGAGTDKGMADAALRVIFENLDGVNVDSYFKIFNDDLAKRFGHPVPLNKEKFMEAFKAGILSASKELIAAFPSKTEFKIWQEASGAGQGSVDIEEAQARLNFIKKHIS